MKLLLEIKENGTFCGSPSHDVFCGDQLLKFPSSPLANLVWTYHCNMENAKVNKDKNYKRQMLAKYVFELRKIPMKRKLRHACSIRGAEMGRRNNIPEDIKTAGKLHLEKLKWVDGDYDYGGCYWGADHLTMCTGATAKRRQNRLTFS